MTALTLEALSKIFQRAGKVVDSIDLRIENGEFFTLLGPSGCGKTTILRMIAGFEEPTSGRVFFDDNDVTREPPNRRNIGLVFQNYALFPHLSVARNVAFGLEVRKHSAAEIDQRVQEALRQVQLETTGAARVDQLSGGQQQRVALARALVIRPRLLLLDEPLSNLDAKLREHTRVMLRALHTTTRVTTIYVTHDQAEAMGMSSRIAILNAGRLQQVGAPEQIYERPANRFVANFIGRNNVVDATVSSVGNGSAVVRFENGRELSVADSGLKPEISVGVCMRAESLVLVDDGAVFEGVVMDVEYSGSVRSCVVKSDVGELRIEVPASAARVEKDQHVKLAVAAKMLHVVSE